MCTMKRHCQSRGYKPSFCRSPFLSDPSSPRPSASSHSSLLQTSHPIQDFIGLYFGQYRAIMATAPLSHLGQFGPLLRPRCRPVSTEGNLRGRHPTIYCPTTLSLTVDGGQLDRVSKMQERCALFQLGSHHLPPSYLRSCVETNCPR